MALCIKNKIKVNNYTLSDVSDKCFHGVS